MVILAGPGSHFVVAAILFASWLFFFGDPRTPTPYITSVETTLNGNAESRRGCRPPARGPHRGCRAASPTPRGQSCSTTRRRTSESPSRSRSSATTRRSRRRSPPWPTRSAARRSGGSVSCWVRPRWVRSPPMVGGVKEVGNAISESLHQITHVFGPSGIGRVFTLLFTDAKRGTQDPTSVVGIGQAVGHDRIGRGLGRRPVLPGVRDGVHRSREPGAAAAVRRRASRGPAHREDPRQDRWTCAS